MQLSHKNWHDHGGRVTVDLEQALRYLDDEDGQTDIMLFNVDPAMPIVDEEDEEE